MGITANTIFVSGKKVDVSEKPLEELLSKVKKDHHENKKRERAKRRGYFSDMVFADEHLKSAYPKDEKTGLHHKNSYIKEFVKND